MESYRIGFKGGGYVDIQGSSQKLLEIIQRDMAGKPANAPYYANINGEMLICETEIIYVVPLKYMAEGVKNEIG